jgi:hypothetical protein
MGKGGKGRKDTLLSLVIAEEIIRDNSPCLSDKE